MALNLDKLRKRLTVFEDMNIVDEIMEVEYHGEHDEFDAGEVVEVAMWRFFNVNDVRIVEAEVVGKCNGGNWIVDLGVGELANGYRCMIVPSSYIVDRKKDLLEQLRNI